jgi:endonuclease YncB( thermonuclease family)
MEDNLRNHGISTPHISTCVSGISTLARLVDIIDGDTIVCVLPLLGKYFKFNIRLNGIDTSEMKSKDPLLRERAVKARNFLIKKTINTPERFEDRKALQQHLDKECIQLYLHCFDFDKYGRLLADVYSKPSDSVSLSTELINASLADEYDGGKKNHSEYK